MGDNINILKLLKTDKLYILLSQVVVSGGGFLITVLLARKLSVQDFGVFVTLWMAGIFIVGSCNAITTLPFMVEYHQRINADKKRYLEGMLGYCLVVAVTVFLVTGVGFLLLNQYGISYIEVGLFFSLTVFQEMVRKILFSMNGARVALLSDVVLWVGRVLLVLISMSTIQDSMYIYIVSCLISLVVVVPFVRWRAIDFEMLPVNVKYAYQINGKHSGWLFLSSVLQWTSVNSFILLAAIIISPTGAAMLRACQSIMAVFNVFIQFLENYLPVGFSRGYAHRSVVEVVNRFLVVGAGLSVFFIMFFYLYSYDVIVYIYGDAYGGASTSLVLYSVAYVFLYLTVPLKSYLKVAGESKSIFISYVVVSVFSLTTVYFLESGYGVIGGVVGVVCSYFLLFVCLYYFYMKKDVIVGVLNVDD
jgi:O-antigen/teichoic acid export membrane protein